MLQKEGWGGIHAHACETPLKKHKRVTLQHGYQLRLPTCLFTTFTIDSDSYINKKLIMTVTMTVT